MNKTKRKKLGKWGSVKHQERFTVRPVDMKINFEYDCEIVLNEFCKLLCTINV